MDMYEIKLIISLTRAGCARQSVYCSLSLYIPSHGIRIERQVQCENQWTVRKLLTPKVGNTSKYVTACIKAICISYFALYLYDCTYVSLCLKFLTPTCLWRLVIQFHSNTEFLMAMWLFRSPICLCSPLLFC